MTSQEIPEGRNKEDVVRCLLPWRMDENYMEDTLNTKAFKSMGSKGSDMWWLKEI